MVPLGLLVSLGVLVWGPIIAPRHSEHCGLQGRCLCGTLGPCTHLSFHPHSIIVAVSLMYTLSCVVVVGLSQG